MVQDHRRAGGAGVAGLVDEADGVAAAAALPARASQASGALTVDVPAEEPAVAPRIAGAGAPPKVRLRGPGGTRIESPSDAASAERPGKWLLVENPADNSTSVLLIEPAAHPRSQAQAGRRAGRPSAARVQLIAG